MWKSAVNSLGFLCLVCMSVAPVFAHVPHDPDLRVPLLLPLECRFLNVWVDYPRYGSGLTHRDLVLNARVAGLVKRELSSLGHGISEEPETAYWAITIMASNTEHRQFVLTATLELRNMKERHASGLVRYARPGERTSPTAYTALIHGSQRELRHRVREYVHRAETALQSTTQALCTYEAHEEEREHEMERQIRERAGRLGPPTPQDPWIPPVSDLELN